MCQKVPENIFELIGSFDQVDGDEHEQEQKPEPEVVFSAILSKTQKSRFVPTQLCFISQESSRTQHREV